MADFLTNSSDILRHLAIRSSTKDSLLLAWEIASGFTGIVQGYRVRYQAIGSEIVQSSQTLPSTRNNFDITHLHENTFYDVCLIILTNLTSRAESCVKAATSTHSLSVALGSTFGAFLALGVVVMFVLLAKWQHFRKNRKLFQQHILSGESTESIDDFCIVQENGDIELNCIEVRSSEQEASGEHRKDGSSPSSEYSADVILHGASVCSIDHGVGLVGTDATRRQRVLIGLDGCSCANSFILTSPSRDSKNGVSYSLLVPLPSSGVFPFLVQQDEAQDHCQDQGHGRCQGHNEAPLSAAALRPGVKVKHQHPVVRLKLRKHSTVDYSSTDDGWHFPRGPHAEQPEVVDPSDQSREVPRAFVYAPEDPSELKEHPGEEDNHTGCRTEQEISGIANGLLNNPQGPDTLPLPRSISNTW